MQDGLTVRIYQNVVEFLPFDKSLGSVIVGLRELGYIRCRNWPKGDLEPQEASVVGRLLKVGGDLGTRLREETPLERDETLQGLVAYCGAEDLRPFEWGDLALTKREPVIANGYRFEITEPARFIVPSEDANEWIEEHATEADIGHEGDYLVLDLLNFEVCGICDHLTHRDDLRHALCPDCAEGD